MMKITIIDRDIMGKKLQISRRKRGTKDIKKQPWK